jgi:hypothetical protein
MNRIKRMTSDMMSTVFPIFFFDVVVRVAQYSYIFTVNTVFIFAYVNIIKVGISCHLPTVVRAAEPPATQNYHGVIRSGRRVLPCRRRNGTRPRAHLWPGPAAGRTHVSRSLLQQFPLVKSLLHLSSKSKEEKWFWIPSTTPPKKHSHSHHHRQKNLLMSV